MIRFSSAAIILCAAISSLAFAQDSTPKVQVFGGYSLLHVRSGGLNGPLLDLALHQFPGTFGVGSSLQGWNAEAQYNIDSWIGIARMLAAAYGNAVHGEGRKACRDCPR